VAEETESTTILFTFLHVYEPTLEAMGGTNEGKLSDRRWKSRLSMEKQFVLYY
jgi:hypothetical protein